MKKIFTILIALLAVVGVKADLVEGKVSVVLGDKITSIADLQTAITDNADQLFLIRNYGNETDDKVSYYTESTSADGSMANNASSPTKYSLVKLAVSGNETDGYTITIQSFSGRYYAGADVHDNPLTTQETAASFTLVASTVTSVGSESYTSFNDAFRILSKKGDRYYTLNQEETSTGIFTPKWHTGGPGKYGVSNIYKATTTAEQEVTYTLTTIGAPIGATYSIGGTEITDNTFPAYASDLNGSSVTVTPPDGTTGYNVLSQTHTESGTTGTYTINFTYNGTVDLSTYTSGNYKATFSDPASSVEAGKWYLLCQNRGNDGYAYDNGGTYYKGIASNFTTGTTLSTSNEVYLFHFVPTATAGVYYIQNADGTLFGAGTDKSNITASSVGYPYNVKVACTSNNITYYYMQSITNNLIVDNNGNGGTTSWWGTTVPTTTGNNTWRFYEVTFEEIPTEEAREALNTALTNANQYKDLIGTDLGKYNDPNADTDNAFLTVLSEAQTMYENNSSTAAQYEEETTKLTTATSALTLNMPSDLSFLRIKSSVTNGYLTSPIIGSTDIATTTTNQDASTIWFFHQGPSSGSTNPGYLLSYYSGEYINPSSGNMGYTIVTANTGTRIEDNSSHFLGTYNIHIPNGGWRYLSSGTTDGNISFGNMSGNPTILDNQTYAWKLEEVTSLPVKMNKAGDGKYYATVCVPVAVSVPTGTTAYAVTNVSGTYATLGNMNGVIPAGAGALLINEDDSEIKGDETNGYYIYLSVDGTAATYTGDNILYGASKAEAVTTTTDSGNTITTNYYFGQLNKTPGFYLGKGSYLSGKYITNRAYLTASAVGGSGSSKGFTFVFGDDDPTGISAATAADEIMENSVRYNLQGQRVDAGYKGIVIIGGKKYLIK